MSIVDTSAQCRSSRNSTTGRDARDVLEERAELALHPLLRCRSGVDRAARAIDDLFDRPRRHLQVPGRRDGLHHGVDERLAAGPVQQAVERFEDRQVGFRARQPLRATAARDRSGARGRGRQLGEEVLDQAGLADARLAGHGDDQASAVLDAARTRVAARARSVSRPTVVRRAATVAMRIRRPYRARLQRRELARPRRAPTGGARASLASIRCTSVVEAPAEWPALSRDERHRLLGDDRREHAEADGATNGRRPAAISYSTTPSAKMSAAGPACSPRACSGDM